MKFNNYVFVSFLLLSSSLLASPITILDNEVLNTPPNSGRLVGKNNQVNEWMGANFTISETTAISSIQAWMYGAGFGDGYSTMGTFSVSIYTDSLQAPNDKIFSGSFTATNAAYGWFGLTGGNLLRLDQGSYWAVFSGDDNNQGFIGMYASTPATPQVYSFNYGSNWAPFNDAEMDIRILGDTQGESVPDSINTFSAMTLVFLGFVAYRRK